MRKRHRKQLPKQPATAHIRGLSHEGRGIAQVDGKTTFITGALPGEEVLFSYTQQRGSFDEGIVQQILQPSAERVTPPCAHADICGACNLQHLANSAQILHKQQTLLDQLRNIGKVEPKQLLEPLTGATLGYRRKARLGVRYVEKKGGMLIGFRERQNPRLLADIDSCVVLHPSVGLLITPLKTLIRQLAGYQCIAQIEVAVGDQQATLIIRNLQELCSGDHDLLIDFARKNQLHIYLQPGGADSVHHIWPEADGEALLSYHLPDYGLELQFRPNDFTQVNGDINRKMIAYAIELLAPQSDETILDLFCGIGNFSLPLAKHAAQVIGVEGDPVMTQRASQNAAINNITNAEFVAADLETVDLTDVIGKQSIDRILIDPPRSGAAGVIPQLAKLAAKRIVYVSCNPATFARDAGMLVNEYGYRLQKVGVMDMFPHTAHVESIAVFDRG